MSASRLAGVRVWSATEVEADAAAARAEFRQRRLGEPLARYLEAYDKAHPGVERWIAELGTVFDDNAMARARLKALLATEEGRTILRYLGAPPISEDDLDTLAETSLAGAARNDAGAERIRSVVRAIVDPRRSPWLESGTPPSMAQRKAAALATTVLMASQRVQTLRRGDEKVGVEGAFRGLLVGMGWKQAWPRTPAGVQKLITDAPAPRPFFVQTNLGSDNADLIVRMDDGRLLAVECKGSNSEINSRKRLNKEAAQNARAWLGRCGTEPIVPAVAACAVLDHSRSMRRASTTDVVVRTTPAMAPISSSSASSRAGVSACSSAR